MISQRHGFVVTCSAWSVTNSLTCSSALMFNLVDKMEAVKDGSAEIVISCT